MADFRFSVIVTKPKKEKVSTIRRAVKKLWSFDYSSYTAKDKTLFLEGEDSCPSDGDEQKAAEIAQAIWKANGAFCEVHVNALYLEELPWESYVYDKEDYDVFKEV